MDFIIGGAYQGKRAWAKQTYALSDSDFFTCEGRTVDYSARAICHLERFALACVRAGLEPADEWDYAASRGQVLIADDISCGVVPMDPEMRAWREATGRFLTRLAGEADMVTRLFCGLPLRLRG